MEELVLQYRSTRGLTQENDDNRKKVLAKIEALKEEKKALERPLNLLKTRKNRNQQRKADKIHRKAIYNAESILKRVRFVLAYYATI